MLISTCHLNSCVSMEIPYRYWVATASKREFTLNRLAFLWFRNVTPYPKRSKSINCC
ncbi:unnamed protein product [Withania somnifera]